MTLENALIDQNSKSPFKSVLTVGLYTATVAFGAVAGVMALLLAA
jgi:hypothetical protein